jgi:hypothetical protein
MKYLNIGCKLTYNHSSNYNCQAISGFLRRTAEREVLFAGFAMLTRAGYENAWRVLPQSKYSVRMLSLLNPTILVICACAFYTDIYIPSFFVYEKSGG